MKRTCFYLSLFALILATPLTLAAEEASAGWSTKSAQKRIAEPGPSETRSVLESATPLQDASYIPQIVEETPNVLYAENSTVTLEELSAELAALKQELKTELGKKANAPDPKKGFTAKLGGRVFMDSVNVMKQNGDSYDAYGQGQNNLGFREARVSVSGVGYEMLDYKVEMGYEKWGYAATTSKGDAGTALGGISFKDVYLGAKNIPFFGYLRVGNQYLEDGSSEVCTGTTNITFMETPSPAGNQFTSRRLGITSRHLFCNDRLRFFSGIYGARNISESHLITDSNQGATALVRTTYAPWYVKDGQKMLLFGGYYNYTDYCRSSATPAKNSVNPGGYSVGFSTLDSGAFDCDNYQKVGGEFVWQYCGFALQGEMFAQCFNNARSDNFQNGDKTSKGGYVMMRQFLTSGDYRTYSKESAAWGTANVSRNFISVDKGQFYCLQGPGAWEVATYLGVMNNEDFVATTPPTTNAVRYGTDYELGFALNWYWNSQTRWSLNYIRQMSDVRSNTSDFSPTTDILGLSCRFFF
ncbi:MAG: porin [Thermoguttaceae bacterium]